MREILLSAYQLFLLTNCLKKWRGGNEALGLEFPFLIVRNPDFSYFTVLNP